MAEDPLAAARTALDRGEYGQVLRLLEPLAQTYPPVSALGGRLRLLMATALLGQGDSENATACCRSLLACSDPELRTQARDLLMVLEAPALQRPRGWSITLPDLSAAEAVVGQGAGPRRRWRPPAEVPPAPPVGPTRAPLGFAALVSTLLLLLLLSGLLGGCMEVRSDLHFQGPGRIRIRHHLRNPSGHLSPWQRRFGEVLESSGFGKVAQAQEQILQTPLLPAGEAMQALAASFAAASDLAELDLPPPVLMLEERNWLVGVRQHLLLDLDLRPLPLLPGLDLALGLDPVNPAAVRRAEPVAVERRAGRSGSGSDSGSGKEIVWRLQAGRRNVLEIRCWRWSPLGLGGVAIALTLLLALALQRIRQRLGYGLPQLPA